MDLIDPSTGIKLTPSYQGKDCLGNGNFPGYECCCDECDFFLTCFPDFNDPDHKYTYGDRRDFWNPEVREESCLNCKHREEKGIRRYRVKVTLFCKKTKRWGRELRANRCSHFEKDEQTKEQG